MKLLRFLSIILLFSSIAWAEPVARVQTIEGNLFIQKSAKDPWYRSHIEQDAEVGHQLKTDEKSTASVRFFLGGKASLGKGCQIKLVSERNIEIVSQGSQVKKGAFWAKFDKQEKNPIQIRTAGGVMGIRGTEFVVQFEEDGTTQLSLIEGSVQITPEVGKPYTAVPGDEVRFGPLGMLSKLYEVEELQGRLQDQLGPEFYNELKDTLEQTRQELRSISSLEKSTTNIVLRTQYLDGFRGGPGLEGLAAGQAGLEAGLRGLEAGLEGMKTGAEETRTAADILRDLYSDEGTKSQSTEQTKPEPEAALISWEQPVAPRYALYFLDLQNKETLYWASETTSNSYTHPLDAEPFAPGQYRLRIIPLNEDGTNRGEAAYATFRVGG